MKGKSIALSASLFIVFCLYISVSFARNNTGKDSLSQNHISEEGFIPINGIKLWVTIKGDTTKPVILFNHGGPGSPITPYSDNVYKDWEKDFIIVQYDQRGAGRTYGVEAPGELTPGYFQQHPLSVQQIVDDGIELTKYLISHLHKQKVILFGTSWGSVVGAKMAWQQPELFYAYVGHSQVVDLSDDLPMYNKVYAMAQKNNDSASLSLLNSIGKPPYDRARNIGKLFRVVKKYESAHSTPPPAAWFVAAPAYNNAKDEKDREDGDDYSFANFAGDKQLGVPSMRSTINLVQDNIEYKIPIYFIQGEEDILTPKEMTKPYFDKIKAPAKQYILLKNSAHGFNVYVVEAQYKIFKSIAAKNHL